MKLEIDLNNIFRDDETGEVAESLEEAIRRQVVDSLTNKFRERVQRQVDSDISKYVEEATKNALGDKLPVMIEDILNYEYTPVNRYGVKADTATTFRNEIIKAISSEMEYKPKNYHSDENAFTRSVRSIVSSQTEALKKEFEARIDAGFRKDALAWATTELAKRMGLNVK